MKKAGILLPIFSLPSPYGMGDFGKAAYEFIDFLKASGQSCWQILPVGPTSFGDSPYQSFSTFALNPYMISLEDLICDGVLKKSECDKCDFGADSQKIDYARLYKNRYPLLKKAYKRSDISKNPDFSAFQKSQCDWLFDYSLFMALKEINNGKPWYKWEDEIKTRKNLDAYFEKYNETVLFWQYLQFKLYLQWNKLKNYANVNGISIIGDIPIYVAHDSADVWANPTLFELNSCFSPTLVSGCPPDGFSKDGQLWGNPVYNWDEHKKTNYNWWIKRIKHCFLLFDVLRIDHFRGFDEFYAIEYGKANARDGKWLKGPGYDLFLEIEKQIGKKNIIAEDLGFITHSVKKLLSDCSFPGMKILQFAFDTRDTGTQNDYLPHNYKKNCIAYTGTHDNQTLISWFMSITDEERKSVREYLCDYYTPDNKIHLPLISLLMRSNAKVCIIPIQDYLGLTDIARINTPSTLGSNWQWRLGENELTDNLAKKIYKMTKRYGRT